METFKTIGDWIETTFGASNQIEDRLSMVHFDRVVDEFTELAEELDPPSGVGGVRLKGVADEAADVVIALAGMCRRYDIDLQAAVDAKMKVNRNREWAVLPNGTGRHINSTKNYDPLGEDFL